MGLLSKRFNTDAGNAPNYSKRSSLILPDEVVTVSPTADVTPSYRESDNAVPGLTILATLQFQKELEGFYQRTITHLSSSFLPV